MAPSVDSPLLDGCAPGQVATKPHSLRALSAPEIRSAAAAVRKHFSASSGFPLRFSSISLLEPCRDSQRTKREAEVVVQQPKEATAHVVVVSFSPDGSGEVVCAKNLEEAQPPFSPDDCSLSEEIVKMDSGVAAVLLERHGISSPEQFCADPWSMHVLDERCSELNWREDGRSARLVLNFLYKISTAGDNPYAHPIDIVPVVDLNAKKVIAVRGENVPKHDVPEDAVNYDRDGLAANKYLPSNFRTPPNPLHIIQPEGPSFIVDEDIVKWQYWDFVVGFNFREGLVLHNVSYNGRGILNRASLVEMAVPYGDPNLPFAQKCAFDVSDYGLGFCSTSLELGCDCLGSIHYFDAVLNNSAGEPYIVKKVVCMHEEDAGLSWKHVNHRTRHNESRRARRLVVSFIATVVNYEYLFYWYFNQDGSIEYEIKLSGELSTNVLSVGEATPRHGTLVAPSVNAQIHQHMFCMRLDPCIDGPKNSVEELEIQRCPADAFNPYRNAMMCKVTPLRSELEARRDSAPARSWRILSSEKVNQITGRSTAYRLVPGTRGGSQPTLLTGPGSAVTQRGAFATHSLWVTRYNSRERFPAGDFPTQAAGEKGLPLWVQREADIEGQDIVVWHSFGVAHLPRVEDFPVMPCESVGFSLKPDGFFLGNPATDLPPEKDTGSVHCRRNQP